MIRSQDQNLTVGRHLVDELTTVPARRSSDCKSSHRLLTMHVCIRKRRLLRMYGKAETLPGNFNVGSRVEGAASPAHDDADEETGNRCPRVALRERQEFDHQLVNG